MKVADHAASYTRPEEVEEFVAKTGCDSLAIAIGTSHGAYKFKPEQCTVNEKGILVPPPLRFDVLEEVSKRLPGFPIVLHGSSSVPQEYVKMINEHGGKMPNAIGVPEEQLRQAARLSVCKINIDSDLQVVDVLVDCQLRQRRLKYMPRHTFSLIAPIARHSAPETRNMWPCRSQRDSPPRYTSPFFTGFPLILAI